MALGCDALELDDALADAAASLHLDPHRRRLAHPHGQHVLVELDAGRRARLEAPLELKLGRAGEPPSQGPGAVVAHAARAQVQPCQLLALPQGQRRTTVRQLVQTLAAHPRGWRKHAQAFVFV